MAKAHKHSEPFYEIRTKANGILAWKLMSSSRILRDDRLACQGRTLSVPPDVVVLCCGGIHGCRKIAHLARVFTNYDATLARVKLWGRVHISSSKIAAQHCTFLWIGNFFPYLRKRAVSRRRSYVDMLFVLLTTSPKQLIDAARRAAKREKTNAKGKDKC